MLPEFSVMHQKQKIVTELLWNFPPNEWRLGEDEIHVWAATLDLPGQTCAALERTLAFDEMERAGRFHFQHDRIRFIVGRATVRAVLGCYLGADPAQLQFAYSRYGKPSLAAPHSGTIHFNASHSHELILIAVTRACAVGVDVERVHSLGEINKIAAEFCSPEEVAKLRAVPQPSRSLAFFNLLTRKEAYLKATGVGLSDQVRHVATTFLPGEPAKILAVSGDRAAARAWSLKDLLPATGFIGAVAGQARNLRLACWRWPRKKAPSSGIADNPAS